MISKILLMLGLLYSAANAASPTISAEDLLKSSDRGRGAAVSLEGINWTADIETKENEMTSQAVYQIKCRGNDALAEVTSPPRQKGEVIIFNDRILWFYKPGLKKPVSISARQKLMGQAANGDIASTQYFRDYDGTILGEEVVDGNKTFKLELVAKAKNVTYDKIRYWISKSQKLGVKAEYLTVSGDVFKTATFKYGNIIKIAGVAYPFVSEMIIRDANNANNETTIRYKNPTEASHPTSIFNVNNLIR
ncbi:MAG: outer membrane lipoprotein-sorting protein [Bdellovibrio sp.]|nr:outer membrane lipoprotein-sorting protein [Bdellovibrio sp.]